jgi:serine/threonine protein kinase
MSIKRIGSGSYGTVFSPPINFNILKTKSQYKITELVGKVVTTDDDLDINQEWEQGKILKEIDPKQEYFIYPIKKMKVPIDNYNEYAKKPYECNETTHLTQFVMLNGGKSIRFMCKKNMMSFKNIINCVLQVANGIKLLQKYNLVHQDIHLGNIVSKNGTYKLIDFGMMVSTAEYFTLHNILMKEVYAINPPEYRILQEKKDHTHNIEFEQKCLAQYCGVHPEDLDYVFKSKIFNISYEKLLKSIKYKTDGSVYLEDIQSYKKSDIYSLGVCIVEMLSYMDNEQIPPCVSGQLWSAITKMLMPHPENRSDVDSVIQKFNSINNILHNKPININNTK